MIPPSIILKLVYYISMLVLLGSSGIWVYERFYKKRTGARETLTRWTAMAAAIVFVIAWLIRRWMKGSDDDDE